LSPGPGSVPQACFGLHNPANMQKPSRNFIRAIAQKRHQAIQIAAATLHLTAQAEPANNSSLGESVDWIERFAQAAPAWLAAMLTLMIITLSLLARLHPGARLMHYLIGMMLSWHILHLSATGQTSAMKSLALALLLLCGVKFLLHQVAWSRRWLGPVLLLQLILMPISSLASLPLPEAFWPWLLALEMLAALSCFGVLAWQSRRASSHAALADQTGGYFTWLSLLLGLTATALLAGQMLPASGLNPWLELGLAMLLLALGLQITSGNLRSRQDADGHRDRLEQSMHAKVTEVERNFNTMVEQKLIQVTERERKRIAADLHDDLGAKLLTIVHTSESDRISTLAREALEEMRLSVRGLTGRPVQLLDALGDWRAEVVARLRQANISTEWKSPPEDIVYTLPARTYVQTTRIFREAISNIIKHSGASRCTVSSNMQDGDFLVVIQDDGQGIPAELDGRLDRGHGMASMKSRARQMHGQCLVESGPGWGTVIRLTIPL
jgi:two-component system, NarL family, sensor histidine kinase UhpB